MSKRVLERAGLDTLMTILTGEGFTLVGPTMRDGAVVYHPIVSTADLPQGWGDEQDGGRYRLRHRGDASLFSYNLGPTSWKRFLFPPAVELLRIHRANGELVFEGTSRPVTRYAFFGVRACEIAAIAIQDRVFRGPAVADPAYSADRAQLFIVAVNCGQAGGTCFCASMGTGPECTTGYDLVISELLDGDRPEYLIDAGSTRGSAILERLGGREATPEDEAAVRAMVTATTGSMGRVMETGGVRDLLTGNPNHPRWARVGARCLTCGNCALACPTCFCSTMIDRVTLDGEAIRTRVWDSCFGLDFTALHGHPVRGSAKSRYRQWMTHKLATWHDQFGTSGCVGCGRCITWCPVRIDITEEVAAMREEALA